MFERGHNSESYVLVNEAQKNMEFLGLDYDQFGFLDIEEEHSFYKDPERWKVIF